MSRSIADSKSFISTDVLLALAASKRRFVHQICEIGAGKAGACARRRSSGRRLRASFTSFAWIAQNLLAAFDVGLVDQNLPVEAPGTEQRRVENFRTVGCAP